MYLYGIFVGSTWAMTRNRRIADRKARQVGGYVVRVTDAPEYHSFDAPTFRVLGDLVADYRTPAVPPTFTVA